MLCLSGPTKDGFLLSGDKEHIKQPSPYAVSTLFGERGSNHSKECSRQNGVLSCKCGISPLRFSAKGRVREGYEGQDI